MKQFIKTEKNTKKDMKSFNNQNKMLYSMSKKTSPQRDLRKFNKIGYKRYNSYISDSYISSESDNSFSSDSEVDTKETIRREIKNMDHVVSTNVK